MRTVKEIEADYNIIKSKLPEGYNNTDLCETEFELRQALTFNISTDRLKEICKAEADGSLLRLPCKVGTELFLSDYPMHHHRLKEYKFLNERVSIVIECWEFQRTCTRWLSDFGKTVFLTPSETKRALKELEGTK